MKNQKNQILHIGLISAVPEELGQILENLNEITESKYGDLTIFSGLWNRSNEKKIYITATWSGWGKVSAARATTRIINSTANNRKVDFLIFTGVAGAANKLVKQWDIVLADSIVQHDMDARPLFKKFEIPSLKKIKMHPPYNLLEKISEILSQQNSYKLGSLKKGLVATGDMFISDLDILNEVNKELPGLLAVEMEGGAFAQVASQENVDWIVIRVISDGADNEAAQDFETFLKEYTKYSWGLIESILKNF